MHDHARRHRADAAGARDTVVNNDGGVPTTLGAVDRPRAARRYGGGGQPEGRSGGAGRTLYAARAGSTGGRPSRSTATRVTTGDCAPATGAVTLALQQDATLHDHARRRRRDAERGDGGRQRRRRHGGAGRLRCRGPARGRRGRGEPVEPEGAPASPAAPTPSRRTVCPDTRSRWRATAAPDGVDHARAAPVAQLHGHRERRRADADGRDAGRERPRRRAAPSGFTVHVKRGGADVPGSPQPGSASGTTYTLTAAATPSPPTRWPATAPDHRRLRRRRLDHPGRRRQRTCTVTGNDDAAAGPGAGVQQLPPPEPGETVNALPESGNGAR